MYIWNKKALEQKLIADSLTEREKFSYVFVLTISYSLAASIGAFLPQEVSEIAIIGHVVILLLTVIGIIWCFQINQNGDGKNFVERFICMGWILSVRVLLLYFAFLIAISVGLTLAYPEQYQESFNGPSIIWDILLGGGVTLIYYWRIAVSITTIANATHKVES